MLFLITKQSTLKSAFKTTLIRRGLKTANERNVVFSNGRVLNLSFGKLSKLADGSSVAKIGNTNVMVSTVSEQKISRSTFIPLTVDYREKSSAGGRIPTNHLRRDLAPTDREILCGRIVDRSIRGSFPVGYFYDTQIVCNVLSIDGANDPDIIAVNAASAALSLSNIPWHGPIGTVRISSNDDKLIVNPTKKEIINSDFNVVVTSNDKDQVVMIEGSGNQTISNDRLIEMVNLAIQENRLIIDTIKELSNEHQVPKRPVDKYFKSTDEQINDVDLIASTKLKEILSDYSLNKKERDVQIQKVRMDILEKLKEKYPQEEDYILTEAFYQVLKKVYSNQILDTGIRCDGRRLDDVRPLYSEVNLYKPLHGSALFQRGQTQVLSTLTFDSPDSALRLNNYGFPDEIKEKNFMLHYEFPKYATNEIQRSPLYGRREIGHGNLAERSLKPIVPDDLPFVVRITCEVLESNGSSSMASVCAGSLAMMDAGLNIKDHAVGIAMGLIKSPDNISNYRILTDILGFEDFYGEMDFKIAGTCHGLTALQLDCKLADGLDVSMLELALKKSEQGRSHILDHMNKTISKPNLEKDNLPVLEKIEVPQHRRSAIIGLGGYNLKKLKAEIGVTITQDIDTNQFIVFAPNQEAMKEAKEYIEEKIKEDQEVDLEFGAIYDANIVEIKEGGVMVKIKGQPLIYLKNKHLDRKLVRHASALGLDVGSEIRVKFFGRDPVTGEIRISRKVLQI